MLCNLLSCNLTLHVFAIWVKHLWLVWKHIDHRKAFTFFCYVSCIFLMKIVALLSILSYFDIFLRRRPDSVYFGSLFINHLRLNTSRCRFIRNWFEPVTSTVPTALCVFSFAIFIRYLALTCQKLFAIFWVS